MFLTHSPILMLCIPDFDGFPTSDRLVRPYFGMRRFDWQDHPSIEFNLTYGGWIAELGRSGFTVEALHECRRPGRRPRAPRLRHRRLVAPLASGGDLGGAPARLTRAAGAALEPFPAGSKPHLGGAVDRRPGPAAQRVGLGRSRRRQIARAMKKPRIGMTTAAILQNQICSS